MPFENLIQLLKSIGLYEEGTEVSHITDGKGCKLLLCETGKKSLFIKQFQRKDQEQVNAEADGLLALSHTGEVNCPKVHLAGSLGEDTFLVMDYIPISDNGRRSAMGPFGRQLANLHLNTQRQVFGYSIPNFIGSLPQNNEESTNWNEFYYHHRLLPQLTMAVERELLPSSLTRKENEWKKIIGLECPDEAASLIHGDLWSGNLIADVEGNPYLIDPAVAYCHREMDLAMTHLFGGFNPNFYTAYEEIYPLQPGFTDRLEIYQLYFLLVHVNLFGRSYVGSTLRIIDKFFGR